MANVNPGNTTAGKNGLGIEWPNARISQFGNRRRAPSSQPRYQSGWAGDDTASGRNGPYSHTGLICTSPPISPNTAAMPKNSPRDFAVYVGKSFDPTTFVSVRPEPGKCVCFWC